MNFVIWSSATIATYVAARWLFLKTKVQFLHPVLVTTLLLMLVVELTGRDYAGYGEGTGWLGWILGPGVVAMAVPVYKLRALIWQRAGVLVAVVVSTLCFSLLSTGIVLWLAGAGKDLIQSLSLKNITAAVAMGIAREVHALPTLAGVGAMFAAVLGAAIGPWVLQRAKVHDPRAVGLAMGCGSHAVGTARAFELGEEQGTFASVGLSLNTLVAAVVCPPLFLWIFS